MKTTMLKFPVHRRAAFAAGVLALAGLIAGVPRTYGVSANDPIHFSDSVWKPMALAQAGRPFCRGEVAVSEAVGRILGHYRPESALVFCNTKLECQEVAAALVRRGYAALAIHGDLEQR